MEVCLGDLCSAIKLRFGGRTDVPGFVIAGQTHKKAGLEIESGLLLEFTRSLTLPVLTKPAR